jgi:hypothetical protein
VQARQLAGEAGYRILEGHAGSALAEIQLACGRPDRAVCPGRSPCQRSASPICTLRVGAGRLPRPPRAWPGGTDDPLLPSGDSQTMIGRP